MLKRVWQTSIPYKKISDFVDAKIEKFVNKYAPNGVLMDRYFIKSEIQKEIFQTLQAAGIEKITKRLNQELNIHLYTDSLLSRLIFNGDFEQEEVRFLHQYLLPGEIFLDVGANVGLFSLYASKIVGQNGKVFAFEPTPKIFNRLQENISFNQLSNVVAKSLAVSNQVGTATFHLATNENDAWNSLAELPQHGQAEAIDVPTTTIDGFAQEHLKDGKIKLIKIDVEGWELPVLQGATQLLTSEHPPILMVEFTEENAKSAGFSCKQVYQFAANLGYQWFTYQNGELKPSPLKEEYPYENLYGFRKQ